MRYNYDLGLQTLEEGAPKTDWTTLTIPQNVSVGELMHLFDGLFPFVIPRVGSLRLALDDCTYAGKFYLEVDYQVGADLRRMLPGEIDIIGKMECY